ncbi:MAG: ATP-binding protein [Chloroflexi bacterium]|nr:ATP-binding protein [Chloroflexota bacterium]
MPFELELLETLLHEEEGASLDFKAAQYPFDKADIGQKAKLLKDILAFTNSWRRATAYILIGVEEVKGKRSRILGVTEHLDDARLHQFVNGKTQRPVEFIYKIVQIEGVEIGVIEIPLQDRPVYLKKRYGDLGSSDVYIRDGSSTRVATPDEIAKMGSQGVLEETPQFSLDWADLDSRTALESPCILHSLALFPPLPDDTFTPPRSAYLTVDIGRNPRYSEEVIWCTFERAFFIGIGVKLYNKSGVLGKNIRFEGVLSKSGGVEVKEVLKSIPIEGIQTVPFDSMPLVGQKPETHLEDRNDEWEIVVEFGDIRPRETVWTTNPFWFGCAHPTLAKLEGQLFGDNLREPTPCSLEIQFEAEQRPMTEVDAAPYLDQ